MGVLFLQEQGFFPVASQIKLRHYGTRAGRHNATPEGSCLAKERTLRMIGGACLWGLRRKQPLYKGGAGLLVGPEFGLDSRQTEEVETDCTA
ncbi:hypothetical protein DPEC_G00256970 [Dallia pectoralis]|uniref:Uncharacterized protein n=1 Tax=Dallia pectoralis TaxID=75939 RepID=A0ACC2FR17_DALPE|nr:hypothetical protein DPEC_G00256970 [Dallia pectoralis]